ARCSSQISFRFEKACSDFAVCPATYSRNSHFALRVLPLARFDVACILSLTCIGASIGFDALAISFRRTSIYKTAVGHVTPIALPLRYFQLLLSDELLRFLFLGLQVKLEGSDLRVQSLALALQEELFPLDFLAA